MYEDKIIKCKDCGREFIFTAGEQDFYNDKKLSDPKRCPNCRQERKQKASEFHDKANNVDKSQL